MSEGLFSLENRVAVFTGVFGQLGRQFTDALTADGFEVEHIIDRVPGRRHPRPAQEILSDG